MQVDTTLRGREIPPSFLGFSIEYHDLYEYLGSPSSEKSKIFIQLIKNLEIFNGPVQIRLGGNSQDETRWNPGLFPLNSLFLNNLDESFLDSLKNLKNKTDSRFVIGLNLGAQDPSVAKAWAQVAKDGLGLERIDSFEIGNEPDFYSGRFVNGQALRDSSWNYEKYLEEYNLFKVFLDPLFEGERRLRGPSFAGTFGNKIRHFAEEQKDDLSQLSFHFYPLHRCNTQPGDKDYPTIEQLLSKPSVDSVLAKLNASVSAANEWNIPSVRMGEGNSVACRGAPGVSDTFAATLWSLDLLLTLAKGGANGVNFHMGGNYAAFYPPSLPSSPPKIMPLYYGMLLFSRMAQNSAQFIPVLLSDNSNVNLKIWATLDKSKNLRIIFVNKSASFEKVSLQVDRITQSANLYRYTAPSVSASSGIQISGQTFDTSLSGKIMGQVQSEKILFQGGATLVDVPAYSAASIILKL